MVSPSGKEKARVRRSRGSARKPTRSGNAKAAVLVPWLGRSLRLQGFLELIDLCRQIGLVIAKNKRPCARLAAPIGGQLLEIAFVGPHQEPGIALGGILFGEFLPNRRLRG